MMSYLVEVIVVLCVFVLEVTLLPNLEHACVGVSADWPQACRNVHQPTLNRFKAGSATALSLRELTLPDGPGRDLTWRFCLVGVLPAFALYLRPLFLGASPCRSDA